jgi:hypothetical protein
MAFEFYVSSNNSTTTSLSDGAPFKFDSLEGISSAPITRFEQRGPVQQGVTDLGYRLGPRVMELSLLFHAASDSQLDTYRQQLMDAFKPLTETPIFLYCERDDGATRRLRVHTIGDIAITLTPELRPAHSHRATLRLRAAQPLWVDESVARASYSGIAGTTGWYLAGGVISQSNVLMSGGSPTQGQTWSFLGTHSGDFTMVFRSDKATSGFAFQSGTATLYDIRALSESIYLLGEFSGAVKNLGSAMPPGVNNYFHVHQTTPLSTFYRGTVPISTVGSALSPFTASNTQRRWRSRDGGAFDVWTPAIPMYALYGTSLTTTQIGYLNQYMSGMGDDSITAVNDGDLSAYPVIKLTGPMANITITNSSTGDSFSFGTIAIAAGDIYTIDLRDGDKQVYDVNGDSKLSQVTTLAGLAGFRLEPSPVAAGGTNTIVVTRNDTAAESRVTIEHYNQYMSY